MAKNYITRIKSEGDKIYISHNFPGENIPLVASIYDNTSGATLDCGTESNCTPYILAGVIELKDSGSKRAEKIAEFIKTIEDNIKIRPVVSIDIIGSEVEVVFRSIHCVNILLKALLHYVPDNTTLSVDYKGGRQVSKILEPWTYNPYEGFRYGTPGTSVSAGSFDLLYAPGSKQVTDPKNFRVKVSDRKQLKLKFEL